MKPVLIIAVIIVSLSLRTTLNKAEKRGWPECSGALIGRRFEHRESNLLKEACALDSVKFGHTEHGIRFEPFAAISKPLRTSLNCPTHGTGCWQVNE